MHLAGIAGCELRRSGYSVAGIVMGLILDQLGESSFTKSMRLLKHAPLALSARPIAGWLLTVAILTLIWNIMKAMRQQPSG